MREDEALCWRPMHICTEEAEEQNLAPSHHHKSIHLSVRRSAVSSTFFSLSFNQ